LRDGSADQLAVLLISTLPFDEEIVAYPVHRCLDSIERNISLPAALGGQQESVRRYLLQVSISIG
jgi:hypothetical protein